MINKRRGDGDTPPPIVRRLRARHRPVIHGAWKVAYADFTTSMMALFIVLWAMQLSPEIRASIANYFRNPSVMSSSGSAGVLPASSGVVGLAQPAGGPSPDSPDTALAEAAVRIRAAIEADPVLRALRDQVRIEMTPEGLRIQLAERDDSLFFEIGSAQVKPALTRVLAVVAQVVGEVPNDVVVEGHTDTRQYVRYDRGYTNWELSADRANSARRVLEGTGLRTRQVVRVVGFADHDLLMQDDPLNAQNRRVSVIVRNGPGAAGEAAATKIRERLKLSARAEEPPR
ncbi:MAG: OmpA family protein [Candidatus Rokubacteria bacterium]|nr:OmpA family protein [Candidatus Rokubacteria bacterium]